MTRPIKANAMMDSGGVNEGLLVVADAVSDIVILAKCVSPSFLLCPVI